MPFTGDFLVCGVSRQLQLQVASFDELISPEDPDFKTSGLLAKSLIRLGFLMVLPHLRNAGVIGAVSPQRHRRLLRNLSEYLRPGP
jgi:mRNA interferase MazF